MVRFDKELPDNEKALAFWFARDYVKGLNGSTMPSIRELIARGIRDCGYFYGSVGTNRETTTSEALLRMLDIHGPLNELDVWGRCRDQTAILRSFDLVLVSLEKRLQKPDRRSLE